MEDSRRVCRSFRYDLEEVRGTSQYMIFFKNRSKREFTNCLRMLRIIAITGAFMARIRMNRECSENWV